MFSIERSDKKLIFRISKSKQISQLKMGKSLEQAVHKKRHPNGKTNK